MLYALASFSLFLILVSTKSLASPLQTQQQHRRQPSFIGSMKPSRMSVSSKERITINSHELPSSIFHTTDTMRSSTNKASYWRSSTKMKSGSSIAMTIAPFAPVKSIASYASRTLVSFSNKTTVYLAAFITFFVTLLRTKFYKRILWPGTTVAENEEPLPPGSFGCPLFGSNILKGTSEYGPFEFFDRTIRKLGNPKVWKFYFFGMPIINVSGAANIKHALAKELEPDGVGSELPGSNTKILMGNTSLLYENDKRLHSFLRRLVGVSMSPSACAQAVPALVDAANEQIDTILKASSNGENVKMEDICNDFTLGVAWRQILGLDLKEDEIPLFYKAIEDWIKSMTSIRLFLPGIKRSKSYKAREYVVNKVERKIADLKRNGPDGSTLGGMVFAKDEESNSKLTPEQILDNALLLILAGSETSSKTLSIALNLFGIHKDIWDKVKAEQKEVVMKHGDKITKEILDKECPYLDSVIKETLRIRPVAYGLEIRKSKKKIVVEGKKIPPGWGMFIKIRQTHENDPVTFKDDGSHMDVMRGFQPERWLDDETKPQTEFLPFGSGNRYCLGVNLAMTEMKVFLALMARRVNFDLVGPTDKIVWRKMSVMPRPRDGVLISPRAELNVA